MPNPRSHAVDSRRALSAPYTHHRLSRAALRGLADPYFRAEGSSPPAGTQAAADAGGGAAPVEPGGQRKRRRVGGRGGAKATDVIENAPGLCDWLSQEHDRWLAGGGPGRSWPAATADPAGGGGSVASGGVLPRGRQPEGEWPLRRWGEFIQQLRQRAGTAADDASASQGDVLQPKSGGQCVLPPAALFERLLIHAGRCDARLEGEGMGAFALPPRCRWLMADAARWGQRLLHAAKERDGQGPAAAEQRGEHSGYRIITLDPPWANKSADRGRRYPTTAWSALPSLPIAELADCRRGHGCLVAVWVTNKRSYWEWLVGTVFPAWGVRYVTTWYWLKVTNDGRPVLPLDKHRERKPFEPLVIGVAGDGLEGWGEEGCSPLMGADTRYAEADGGQEPGDRDASEHRLDGEFWWAARCGAGGSDAVEADTAADADKAAAIPEGGLGELWRIPLRQVVLSVPMAHSAKPPLDALLERCFRPPKPAPHRKSDSGSSGDEVTIESGGGAGCGPAGGPVGLEEWTERLELFARGLRPGWTAVGNEVLAQQQLVSEDAGDGRAAQQQQGLFVSAEA